MKRREFNISRQSAELDIINDLDMDVVEEYITEDLEVPPDCIYSFELLDAHVNIKLSTESFYFNDDWYINLQRVA